MRAIVKPACCEQGDKQNGNRNFPELRDTSRRSFCHRYCARACRRTPSALEVPLQALQVRPHIGCVLIAQIAVFLQSLVDDLFQLRWGVRIQPHDGRGNRVQNGFEDDARAFPTEWQRTRSRLVQHCAKGEQIRSGVQFLGTDLLRRHVGNRSQRRSRTGQVLFQRQSGLRHHRICSDIGERGCHFRQAKVENLGVPAVGDKDIGGLDVPMDDPLGVRGVEGVGDLDGER